MLPVVGSKVKHFREEVPDLLLVLAVFQDTIHSQTFGVLHLGYCLCFQVFRGSILRILAVLAIHWGSVLRIPSVLSLFRPFAVLMLPILAVLLTLKHSHYTRSVVYTGSNNASFRYFHSQVCTEIFTDTPRSAISRKTSKDSKDTSVVILKKPFKLTLASCKRYYRI